MAVSSRGVTATASSITALVIAALCSLSSLRKTLRTRRRELLEGREAGRESRSCRVVRAARAGAEHTDQWRYLRSADALSGRHPPEGLGDPGFNEHPNNL
jgi:hypothetical protein